MGVWGTAIFSDDTARDVREDYQDFLGDGLSGPEATSKLLAKWSSSLKDPDEAPVFWLALAATQWKCRRLEQNVLREALNVIENGSDLVRWEAGSRDYKKREAVLHALRSQLESPQPRAKHIRKRFRDWNEWQVGDLVAYRLLSSRLAILRVIGHHADKGGTSPICELLDWVGDDVPDQPHLESLAIRKRTNRNWGDPQLMLSRTSARQRPDDLLGVNVRPSQTPRFFRVLNWKWLDHVLKEDFGFE